MGRFYATTPIYYVNDAPHIGHAYTTVVADALARWHRLLGDDVLFLTGTDEHGLKNKQAADALGIAPQELADRNAARYRQAWSALDVSFDDFIRTTEARHVEGVKAFLQAVFDSGDIELDRYEGLYCVACEAYYGEDELVDGNCPVHGRPVEHVSEENWFFRLSRYQQRLLDWYDDHPEAIVPATRRNEVLAFIRQGLADISISRAFDWGVRLPWDEAQVAWVWFDALPNYVTAIGYGTDPERFGTWWPADYHLIGKDIVRFHAVYWPAMLMAAGLEPPRCVAAHGWLLVGGEKMSKTRLNQISPTDLVDDFGVDAVRYHLLREVAFGPDGDFSYESMTARYNADLANNYGNLLSRTSTLIDSKCDGVVSAPRADSPLAAACAEAVQRSLHAWDRLSIAEALEATWSLIHSANALLEATEPWKAEPGPEVDGVLGDAAEALRVATLLASPAMPSACAAVWERLGLPGSPDEHSLPEAAEWGRAGGGHRVVKGPPLFPRRR